MAETTTLREVEWIDHERGTYRTCDICDDAWGIRKFYFDDAEGLCVCEHCVEKYLEENQ